MQTEAKQLKGFIHEWIDAEMEGLKKQARANALLFPDHDNPEILNLIGYWYALIRSAMIEGTIEELIRTKATAINSFLELGKSPEWIEENLNVAIAKTQTRKREEKERRQ